MVAISSWSVSPSCILSLSELERIWEDLDAKALKSKQSVVNRVIFALATFCGMRVSSLIQISLKNVAVNQSDPAIYIPGKISKGGKSHITPIWSERALKVLKEWKAMRIAAGAGDNDPFVCSISSDSYGNALDRQNARKRFKTAISILGADKKNHTTIHHGRHTFISLCLHRGVSIVAVKSAVSHSSIAVTNIYAHLMDKKKINID